MNVRMWASVFFLLAGPAALAAETGGTSATRPSAPSAKKGAQDSTAKDSAAKKAAPGTKGSPSEAARPGPRARPGAKAAEDKSGVTPAARSLARRTRSVFMFAMESCQGEQARCDAALRDDSEHRFMDACGACTTFERCETDRKTIRDGTAKAAFDPCAP
jgi:hypothetical protein